MPQTSLGFALQSLPLPESRAASSAADASLRVRTRTCPGAVPHARREGFRCALDPEPRRGHEAHDRDHRDGTQLPASPRPPNLTRVAPRSGSTTAHVTGLADHTAGSPASKLCSLRESVRAAARSTCRSLRPDPLPERRADALLRLSPSGAFSTVPRVRSIAREPGEPDSPGRPRPAPVVERGASILRPRPSESDGCARLAGRSTPTADVAHVRAPSRRRPCLSCPLSTRAATNRGATTRGLQRSEGYGGGSISWETNQLL